MPARPANQNRRLLGKRVAAIRHERGWTQEMLADRLAVSVRYLQGIEAGQENLTIDSLTQLASKLGVSLADLMDHTFGTPTGAFRLSGVDHDDRTASRAADAPRRRRSRGSEH